MKSSRSSRSGPFLIELIVAILFFAVASATCMQLFVNAHLISRESGDLTQGVIVTQNAAECFKNTHGDGKSMARLLGGEFIASQGAVNVYYDRQWQPHGSSGSEDAMEYMMSVTIHKDRSPFEAHILVVSQGAPDEEIYALVVKDAL